MWLHPKIEVKKWDKYWDLTVIQEVERHTTPSWQKKRRVECICSCWNKVVVYLDNLRKWNSKSCWCNINKHKETHWLFWTHFYYLYKLLINRTRREKNTDWKDFISFKEDMYNEYTKYLSELTKNEDLREDKQKKDTRYQEQLKEHIKRIWWLNNTHQSQFPDFNEKYEKKQTEEDITLFRKDENLPYTKNNCFFATKRDYLLNSKYNIPLDLYWCTNLYELARLKNIDFETVVNRMKKWMSAEDAINTPVSSVVQKYWRHNYEWYVAFTN